MAVILFAGDYDVCLPGMDAYVGSFENVSMAMECAESDTFDWAHIAISLGSELQIVNIGKFNERKRQMAWIRDERCEDLRRNEAELRQIVSVLKLTLDTGIVVFDELKDALSEAKTYTQLITEMIAMSEQVKDKIMTADAIYLEAMAMSLKDILNRVASIVQSPIRDDKKKELHRRWIASVRAVLKEYEWIRPMPIGIK